MLWAPAALLLTRDGWVLHDCGSDVDATESDMPACWSSLRCAASSLQGLRTHGLSWVRSGASVSGCVSVSQRCHLAPCGQLALSTWEERWTLALKAVEAVSYNGSFDGDLV